MDVRDLGMVLGWRNHPKVRSFMFTQHEIGAVEHSSWFSKVHEDSSRRLLIIERNEEPFGFVQFNNVSCGATSEWGFYVSPDAVPGSGRRLGVAAIDHAFKEFGLNKVRGVALENNRASVALHQWLGFVSEGVSRTSHPTGSEDLNVLTFGLLKEKWSPQILLNGLDHGQN